MTRHWPQDILPTYLVVFSIGNLSIFSQGMNNLVPPSFYLHINPTKKAKVKEMVTTYEDLVSWYIIGA